MSNKPSDNDERYKTLGFESSFDGSAGGVQWSELVEELKTNLLRQDLRVRKFIMGEYTTKVGDKDLAKVPTPLPDDWDATVKRQNLCGVTMVSGLPKSFFGVCGLITLCLWRKGMGY